MTNVDQKTIHVRMRHDGKTWQLTITRGKWRLETPARPWTEYTTSTKHARRIAGETLRVRGMSPTPQGFTLKVEKPRRRRMTMNDNDKKREKRLRRALTRKGYALRKSRAGESLDNLGGYMIYDPCANLLVAGDHFNLTLDDVEAFLKEK